VSEGDRSVKMIFFDVPMLQEGIVHCLWRRMHPTRSTDGAQVAATMRCYVAAAPNGSGAGDTFRLLVFWHTRRRISD
jgi:hypothetical protein